jgi:iron complex outermembrane recepter protein
MFQQKHISRAVLALCASLVATSGLAQQQGNSEQPQRLEITGSRIKRVNSETPSEIRVITAKEIERSGATTVTELLKTNPASNAGGFDENAVASYTPGAGGVSLRGLGAQATLVLINGRRVAPYGFASGGQQTFVDINAIPLEVIERVEILLDGASAVYGSDAIAGVVNVILKQDYQGLVMSGGLGISDYGDAGANKFSMTYGTGSLASDGYNIFGSFSHSGQDPVKASDRPTTRNANFSRYGIADYRSSYSGNLYSDTDGSFLGTLDTCKNVAHDGSSLDGRCVYDGTQHQDVVADTERTNLFIAGTLDLGSNYQMFGDLSLVQNHYKAESPSYSTSTYNSTGTLDQLYIILPADHPQNPYGEDVRLRYRFDDVAHYTSVVSNTQRVVLGVRNSDFFGWDAESAVMYSHSNTTVTTTGLLRDSYLLDGVLDPSTGKASTSFIFGDASANSASLMSSLYPTLHDHGSTSTTSIDAHASHDLFKLPGGNAAIALGVEVREEEFKSTPDSLTANGELSVLGAAAADGSRTVSAAYAEMSLPVLKTVEGSVAARLDHYSDFGSAITPKVGLKWTVLPSVALRGTYSKGFRAPSLTETSSTPSTGFYSGVRDPVLCKDPTDTTNTNCDMSVKAISGSNPDLKPEKSTSFTAGVVLDPTDNLSIAVDGFRIKRRDEINSMDVDYLLANESQFPGYVTRNATTGEIEQLNLLYTNLGSTTVWGYDVDVKSSFNLSEWGKLTLQGYYNRTPHYLVANVKGADELDYAGTWLQPKDRYSVSALWEYGPWNTQTTVNYVGGYLRAYSPNDTSCSYATSAPTLCRVPSWITTDLNVGYTGFKGWNLILNIKNLANKSAPIDERRAARYTLFNSSYHNQLGRYFTVSAKYTFW